MFRHLCASSVRREGHGGTHTGGSPRRRDLRTLHGKGGASDCSRNAEADGDLKFFRAYHFPARSKSSQTDESGERNDSVWAIIGGVIKGFNLSLDYVLYELSYTNLIMLGAALPSYDTDKDEKGKDDDVIDASDPANQARVRELLGIT